MSVGKINQTKGYGRRDARVGWEGVREKGGEAVVARRPTNSSSAGHLMMIYECVSPVSVFNGGGGDGGGGGGGE